MLKEIEIQNFRCFEQIKISGFERVNLIGGKNNAGKTALLEALFLNFAPDASSLVILRDLRREPSKALEAMPDRAWDNLFYALKKDRFIVIIGKDDNNNTDRLEIKVEINSIKNKINFEFMRNEDQSTWSLSPVAAGGLLNFRISLDEVPIIPSWLRISGKKLTEAYDNARLDDKDSEVLKAFQILDPTIESVESFSIGEPTLYLRRKGEKRLPLSLFGDAINRVAEIILKLVNSEHKILLIDEIENGIHYKNQREFWRVLCSSAYFELARKLKTNQIIGSRLDLETLNYALEHKEGVRGE
ncbi:MAG: hypothetical protein EA000_02075 [Oscillatoriales cyanobacterium]|nr:MAG: hypothetical protein EA000_02075 [Oscillatoriales cyanobacterium]